MTAVRAVLFDIDGTLADYDGLLAPMHAAFPATRRRVAEAQGNDLQATVYTRGAALRKGGRGCRFHHPKQIRQTLSSSGGSSRLCA